jgi:hypothetical protein
MKPSWYELPLPLGQVSAQTEGAIQLTAYMLFHVYPHLWDMTQASPKHPGQHRQMLDKYTARRARCSDLHL